jgi:phenylpyruvate tautomerase PptA (4-oxalocrotonate tautomerase family)
MALARIEVLEGRRTETKRGMVQAVRAALSEALQTPTDDPVVRLAEYPRHAFTVPYPDRHTDAYTLVEVTMFAGRSQEAKRRLYESIVRGLGAFDVPPEDVLIVIHEPPMGNWGVDGGTPASEVDVGFKVDV